MTALPSYHDWHATESAACLPGGKCSRECLEPPSLRSDALVPQFPLCKHARNPPPPGSGEQTRSCVDRWGYYDDTVSFMWHQRGVGSSTKVRFPGKEAPKEAPVLLLPHFPDRLPSSGLALDGLTRRLQGPRLQDGRKPLPSPHATASEFSHRVLVSVLFSLPKKLGPTKQGNKTGKLPMILHTQHCNCCV